MSDPLADYTNLSQDEIDPQLTEDPVNEEGEQQQQQEEGEEIDDVPDFEDLPNYEEQVAQQMAADEQEQKEQQEQADNQQQEEDRQEPVNEDEILISKLPEGEDLGDDYVQKKPVAKRARPEVYSDDDEEEFDDNVGRGGNNSSSSGKSRSYRPSDDVDIDSLDPQQRKRFELEERMSKAIKPTTKRRKKADEDDLERMQDDKIDYLKEQMIKAATLDVEKNSQGQIATEKLKLLSEVTDVLSRADLAISILDNNLLEAVRLWLEPLPDASMPAYQIQKELIKSLETLPIKTDHLAASGIGKVLVFYQRSKRTEASLKKIVDRLIGDWTRPILNKSDSYKDRSVQFHEYNKTKYSNKLSRGIKRKEAKTLYEQNAERRKRAAIPSARSTAYKIAPSVDKSILMRQQARHAGNDERFKKINQKLTSMSTKRKTVKKGGPSIEGRDLAM
ncbi:IWS1 Transcription factor IWS1 [Candida maltosa Xu316]